MPTDADVLIVGGGIIGLSTAYFLAREGLSVEVLDQGELGAEASWAGAGIIPPGNPENAVASGDVLRAVSSRMFPSLTQELLELTGIDNGYRICGGIEILPRSDAATVQAWRNEGVEFEAISSERSAALEPRLHLPAEGAYALPGMAQVRNPWHLRMLIAGCTRLGVRLKPLTPIRQLERKDNRVVGVRLDSGEIATAGAYLIAAGAWSDSLLKPLGFTTGIHPVRGQIVLLKTPAPLICRVVLLGKNYLVPRDDGHVLIGATEEPDAGFVKQNTASAVVTLIALGASLVPELARAAFVKSWAGLRPGSLDNLPSMGLAPGFPNLYVASGHFRAGVQLSPGTALVMSQLILGRKPSIALDDFRPGRQAGPPFQSAFRS